MASHSERRRAVRIAINGNLNVESETGGQPLRLVDVGMGGFSVRALVPISIDALDAYRFTTPDRKWSVTFSARTIHCNVVPSEGKTPQQYVIGLMFVDTEPSAAQRELMALMDYAMNFAPYS